MMLRVLLFMLLVACGASRPPSTTADVVIPEAEGEAEATTEPAPVPTPAQLELAANELKALFTGAAAMFSMPDAAGKPWHCVVAAARAEAGEPMPGAFEMLMYAELPAFAAAVEFDSPFGERCEVPLSTDPVYVFRIVMRTEDTTQQTLSLRIASDAEGWLYRSEHFDYADESGRRFQVDDEGERTNAPRIHVP